MDEQEMKDAAVALLGWLESQDISKEDAVPILAHALRAIVHTVAKERQRDASEGLVAVANMIRED